MLNARRHQRDGHAGRPGAGRPGAGVLQRPKASEGMGTILRLIARVRFDLCSTPEASEGWALSQLFPRCQCRLGAQRPKASEGWARLSSVTICRRACSAQRPKASEGWAPSRPQKGAAAARAQRPKASEGWAPDQLHRQVTHPQVLNARRHQRDGHSSTHPHELPAAGAQRPKASEGWHGATFLKRLPMQCAQRPKASEGWARDRCAGCGFGVCVLNARRHQRDGHNPFIESITMYNLCSTPEGIRGMGTTCLVNSLWHNAVLNAEGIRGMGTSHTHGRAL